MKNRSQREKLLDAVLNEESYAEFRAQLYGRGLSELRGRRRRAARTQVLALAACLALLLVLVFVFAPATRLPADRAPFEIVRSIALSEEQLIRTTPQPIERIFTSPSNLALGGASPPLEVIRSGASSSRVPFVPDQELLDLFAGHSVALISTPSAKLLLFSDPEDAEVFWGARHNN